MMNKLFIIDDNFLTNEEIEDVRQNLLVKSQYHFVDAPPENMEYDNIHIVGGDQFYYPPSFKNTSMDENAITFTTAKFLLNKFAIKNNISIKEIKRSRSVISCSSEDRRPTPPHIDDRFDHYVFLYYANDSDGNTDIFNEVFDDKPKDPENFTLFKRLTPSAGTGILFPGHTYHTWQTPYKNKFRCVINMNVLINE